jgi:hypothetical protein
MGALQDCRPNNAPQPWHGLLVHRLLGSTNRARKPAHDVYSGFCVSHGGCPTQEPRVAEEVPI